METGVYWASTMSSPVLGASPHASSCQHSSISWYNYYGSILQVKLLAYFQAYKWQIQDLNVVPHASRAYTFRSYLLTQAKPPLIYVEINSFFGIMGFSKWPPPFPGMLLGSCLPWEILSFPQTWLGPWLQEGDTRHVSWDTAGHLQALFQHHSAYSWLQCCLNGWEGLIKSQRIYIRSP